MKNHFLILLVLFLFSVELQSQQLSFNDLFPGQFKGVKAMEGHGYFAYFLKRNNNTRNHSLDLVRYDQQLNQLSSTSVEVQAKSAQINGIHNNKNFLFSITEPKRRRVSYMSFDENGIETGKILQEKHKRGIFKKVSLLPRMFSSGEDGFVILDYKKAKTLGYRIRKFDGNLNLVWEHKFQPEHGLAKIKNVISNGNVLLIVRQITEKSQITEVKNEIISFDAKTGEKRFALPLINDERKLVPSAFMISEDEGIIFGGMYFSNNLVIAENSDGIFFMEMDKSGQLVKSNLTPWKGELQETLEVNFPLDAWYSTGPKVLFQDIKKIGNNYQFIGEAFRKAASGTAYVSHMLESTGPGSNLMTLDFVVFEVSQIDLSISNTQFIEKEKMTVWVPTDSKDILPIENYFKEYDLFSYRFCNLIGSGLNSIVYYNWGKGRPYIGYAILTDATRINPKKIYLDKDAVEHGSTNVLKSKDGEILIYERDKKNKTLKMWIEKIN